MLQAVSTSKRMFTFGSIRTYGNTHDSLAFKVSSLGEAMTDGRFPAGFCLVGDEAYMASNQMLTPWPGVLLSRRKDSFNFYQSRMRIPIECSFGLLVQRWGILWRSIRLEMRKVPALIQCLLMLNNIATKAGVDARKLCSKTIAYQCKKRATPNLELHINPPEPGRRRDREPSARRIEISNILDQVGLYRPQRSRWGRNRL